MLKERSPSRIPRNNVTLSTILLKFKSPSMYCATPECTITHSHQKTAPYSEVDSIVDNADQLPTAPLSKHVSASRRCPLQPRDSQALRLQFERLGAKGTQVEPRYPDGLPSIISLDKMPLSPPGRATPQSGAHGVMLMAFATRTNGQRLSLLYSCLL